MGGSARSAGQERMGRAGIGLGLVLAILACSLLGAGPVDAQQVLPSPGKPGNPICLKLREETPEVFGPTDVGATSGNQRLSVAVNPEGSLSVFRWPSVSYWEQLKYFTVDRDLPRLGLNANEGAFSGLALRLRGGGRRTVWLRDLPVTQRYGSEDSDTVVTRFRSRSLGLLVEIDDVVSPRGDVLQRRHVLRLERDSRVRSARLLAFANLNPTASKRRILPTEDWCEEVGGTDRARYDRATDALVYRISERDQSTGRHRSVAVAIAGSARSDGHQVGADTQTRHLSTLGGPQSAYDDAADGRLGGSGAFGPAEVDAALSMPLGRRPVTLTFAAGEDPDRATALLRRYRHRDAVAEARAKRRGYLDWLARAPLPRDAPASVVRLSKRALISLRQAIGEEAGQEGDAVAIVASLSTQSPYFLDWIRDGAFLNEALDEIGHPDLVDRHNAFYAEVQKKLEEGSPPGSPASVCEGPTPAGNWFQTNYADGPDAGTFTWEIDEAGFGLWTLWRHYERERSGPRRARARRYLERSYAAIRRTADFLVAFRDPLTALPPATACEDDNPPRQPKATMHSAGPVLLGMRSAESAARELGRPGDLSRFRRRRIELERAIEREYHAEGGAWTADVGDGGWALWPVRVKPYGDPRSRAQAELTWRRVAPHFQAPHGPVQRGAYEAKALHGLAHYYRAPGPRSARRRGRAAADSAGIRRVKRGLEWIADVQAAYQGTGILGETWYVRDGRVFSLVAQPHIWEQVLFYLAALEAYGRAPYRAGKPDDLLASASRSGPEREGHRDNRRGGQRGAGSEKAKAGGGKGGNGGGEGGGSLAVTGLTLGGLMVLGLGLVAAGRFLRSPSRPPAG
jgi:glucoamylase